MLGERDTKLGAVETWQHAQACAGLFRKNRDRIDGVLVCLPNFGDEKGVADVLRLAGLNVPVLVQASPDDLNQFNVQRRRDAFCGKISVCNDLRQCGIPFTLIDRHTVGLTTQEFKHELLEFVAVCRVVRGMRRARVGAIGARPNAFNTTRYSGKLLEASGISVSTLDLSEVLDGARRLDDSDGRVKQKLADITG
jgi:L-fucose isomerase-like protein